MKLCVLVVHGHEMLLDRFVSAVSVADDDLMSAGDNVVQALLHFRWEAGNVPRAADGEADTHYQSGSVASDTLLPFTERLPKGVT